MLRPYEGRVLPLDQRCSKILVFALNHRDYRALQPGSLGLVGAGEGLDATQNLERRAVIETAPAPWQGAVLPLYQHRSETWSTELDLNQRDRGTSSVY